MTSKELDPKAAEKINSRQRACSYGYPILLLDCHEMTFSSKCRGIDSSSLPTVLSVIGNSYVSRFHRWHMKAYFFPTNQATVIRCNTLLESSMVFLILSRSL